MDQSSKPGAAVAEPVADVGPVGIEDDNRERFWQTVERIGARNAEEDPDEVLRFVTGGRRGGPPGAV